MQENASSSRNANSEIQHVIASLEPAAKGGFFFVIFHSREPIKILKDIARKADLAIDLVVSESRIRELLADNEAELAKKKGLDYLARRQHAEKELCDKLAKKGFSKPAIHRATLRLRELGLLDDLEFCRSWIRSKISAKKSSRNEMYGKLLSRGIARDTARQALEELLPADEETALCKSALTSMLAKGRVTAEKAMARLSRRGFPWPVIKRAVAEQPEEHNRD